MELLLLCIKIFMGRLIDVSLATLVTVYVVKSERTKATIIGFIDVFIWFIIVKEALNTEIQSIWIALAYAGGYAAGTYVGTVLSQLFNKGTVSVQIITKDIKNSVTKAIKDSGYSASIIKCKGLYKEDTNYMIYAQIENKSLKSFKNLITDIDKNAFITVTESKEMLNGYIGK